MEGNLLYSESTDLNVKLIQKKEKKKSLQGHPEQCFIKYLVTLAKPS